MKFNSLSAFSLLFTALSTAPMGTAQTIDSSFKVYNTQEAQTTCMLNNQVKAALDNNGFSKIMCPFGILVFADADYSDDVSHTLLRATMFCVLSECCTLALLTTHPLVLFFT